MNVKAFYAPLSENRTNVRSGIFIYPLPDCDQILRDRIYIALKARGIQTSDFIITDPTSIVPWCKAIGIDPINAPSLLCVWTYKTHPETCIQLVQKIVREHVE